MINRTLIRLKVVQILYAYFIRENNNADAAEKELAFSLTKAYDLYCYLLLLLVELKYFAQDRIDLRKAKLQPTHADLHPNMRFVENRFLCQLAANTQLEEYKKNLKRSWHDEEDFMRSLFDTIERSSIYEEYMALPETDYETDCTFCRKIYKTFIGNNESLDELFEDQSLYWNDDKAIVDTFVLKTMKTFDEANGAAQPLLPDYREEEDRVYASRLIRQAIMGASEYQHLIDEHSKNWDKDRIAFMDRVILVAAMAEIVTFPSIPLSVSFNEYIEMSKYYSTPKSSSFINGVLDAVTKQLKSEGRLTKE